MRAKHTAHSLPGFPVYSAGFISADTLVLGGGGGSSRAGIKNKLKLLSVGSGQSMEILHELELEQDADAPMSMAVHPENRQFVCGINSAITLLEKGRNENCRLYGTKDKSIVPLTSRGTLITKDLEDYQRVTALSPDGKLIAACGLRDFSVLDFPSLDFVAPTVHIENGEIYDATFSSENLVVVTTSNLLIYLLPNSSNPSEPLKLVHTVDCPSILGETNSAFRSARYHPVDEGILYTVCNTTSSSRRSRSRVTPRQGYVCKWDTKTWQSQKHRKVSDRGLTCFDISPDGKYLAFGSSDYTIGLLDTTTLAPLLSILKAHEFPPTTVRFNPTSELLVSASPDNSIRLVSIPMTLGGQSWTFILLILLTLLVVLLGTAVQAGYLAQLRW